ncbi:MAG: GNAT family N-acetyltransferase [Tabrizicola sp.]|jgi:ribosomal protein S18 acetylase RimI-like enzyme|nr:GNAT family N-acetyltransferase [Tabrizicola sp.]
MSGADIIIRRIGPSDAALVLAAEVFDHPASEAATRRFLGPDGRPDARNILILAWLNGEIVGFVSGTVLDHPDKPRNLFLQELGVNEPARGRGIAKALIAALRAEGRARGCQATWVLTEAGNTPARATYAAAGGEETTGVVMYEWNEGRS